MDVASVFYGFTPVMSDTRFGTRKIGKFQSL